MIMNHVVRVIMPYLRMKLSLAKVLVKLSLARVLIKLSLVLWMSDPQSSVDDLCLRTIHPQI